MIDEETINNGRLVQELLPPVRTTKGDIEPFNSRKILESLMKETGINRDAANKITQKVIKRIISSDIQWLSGPEIRELCCSVLAENGLLAARKRYTRLGMPLMDYEKLLETGIKENANQYNNPESIHSWCANRISSEYVLLRLIPEEHSRAHLRGDIHIHKLRYFDLRPFCQEWDLRAILKYGLPPTGWSHSAISSPAKHAMVAVLHAAKWLGIIQGEFSLPYWEKVLIEEDGNLQWRKIGEVVEENLESLKQIYTFSFNPQTLKMEKKQITNVHKHHCRESFLRIQTEYGREITITKHHSLFTMKEGEIIPISGKDLNIGDYILIPKRINYKKEIQCLNLADLIFKKSSSISRWFVRSVKNILNSDQINKLRQIDKYANQHLFQDSIPLEIFKQLDINSEFFNQLKLGIARSPYEIPAQIPITEKILFLLGVYVAEGSGSYKKFNFTLGAHEKDFIQEVKISFKSVFGIDLKERHPHETVNQLSLDSELFRELFEDIFQCGHGAHNKRIPTFIFGLKEKYIRAFLRGYFLGDGHCRNSNINKKRIRNSISAKTISNQLIEDLNFLLLRIGVVASITHSKKVNKISIYGKKYLDIFLRSFKDKDLNWKSEETSFIISPTPLLIPTNHSGLKNNLGNSSELNHIERSKINRKQRIGEYHLQKLLSKIPDSSYKGQLLRFINGDLALLQIKKIEKVPLEEFAYDFEVRPDNKPIENFVAGRGLIIAHNSGGQGFDNFNVFLAPYLVGKTDEELEQLAQCFVFESNQIYAARGAQVPFTSISCLPTVPKSLQDVKAVSKGGKYDGVYGDYVDETRRFFRAINKVYYKGDGTGKMFNFPKHEVKIKADWLKKFEDEYFEVCQEAAKFGTPYFLNMAAPWLPEEVHSQCCRIILTPEGTKRFCHDTDLFDWHKSYMNMGSLQSVSLNLPRYAYIANGDDDKLIELIDKHLKLASEVLQIKRKIIKKRLENNLIPLCAGEVEGTPLLDLRKQSLSIGFVGLNECVLAHTGHELHETDDSYNLGLKILRHLSQRCEEFSVLNQINFSLWEQPAESTASRFARLDLKHYPDKALPLGDPNIDSVYYTNSDHLNYTANIPLTERISKQAEFHPIVKGGVITHLWLGESHPDPESLWKFTKNISLNTPTAYFAYTLDFSQCLKCNTFSNGILTKCPKCGAGEEHIEWWSRVTGYYSRVKRYNKGKLQEWRDRKRTTL
ncbi:MAG: anaerobic ribonucleoside-triphosphate reductase [Candidatus Lokiarchaeota archaeon]|nr:anaerobic ribonucleoside-triphosphate reductase [Candidatus Lokiarchaeota archaeon]